MSGNLIRTRLKALFLKDELVDLYIEKFGEILNLEFVEQLKEELRCNEKGEKPPVNTNVGANSQQESSQLHVNKNSQAARFIRIKLKAIFMKESLVDLYLKRYGEIVNQVYIDELKAEVKAAESGQSVAELSEKAGADAIFECDYVCPACKCNTVIGYNLRSKSQVINETLLLVPHYASMGQYSAVDFSVLQTAVCPKCLYASPDPKDWTRINKFNNTITDSQLSVHTHLLSEIRAQEKERHARFPDAGNPNYFLRPRTYKKGLESIELSLMRARLEKGHLLPAVNYKIGKQYLKSADIKARNGEDPTEYRNEALKYVESAVKESDCNNLNLELECLYLVIVMSLAAKDKDKAGAFIKVAKDILTAKKAQNNEEPSAELRADIAVVEKWIKRISLQWDYRDEDSHWTTGL